MNQNTIINHILLNQTALTLSAALCGSFLIIGQQQAQAAAIIFNTGDASTASTALGVNNEGHLNTRDLFGGLSTSNTNSGDFGIAKKFSDGTWRDASAPGCLCEGWGVSGTLVTSGTSHSGYANVAIDGVNNLTDLGFLTDAAAGTGTFATSNVTLGDIDLLVTQDYRVASNTSDLFENKVTITNNTGEVVDDLRYVRVMDWDIPDDEFNEFVSIQGTATTTFLEKSHDDGFTRANPLGSDIDSPINPGTLDVDFIDNGPTDHGAYFRFNFGSLGIGETREFSIFYGAADSESTANAAVSAEAIELLSYGQFSGDPTGGTPATYIFGFKGVGGKPVIPTAKTPEPSSIISFFGLSVLGMVFSKSKRK